MKLVIPCAGKGTRLKGNIAKPLVKVNGRSLLGHITYAWSDIVDGFIIVVSPENQELIRQNCSRAEFVVQKEPKGLADAILQAEPYIKGKFIINLGDCIFRGEFDETNCELGIAIKTSTSPEINKNFLVKVSPETGHITTLVEKPRGWHSLDFCGMGIYFLDDRVFDYIRRTTFVEPSGGDFTFVLQKMINEDEKIAPVWFRGNYANINTQEDIKKAEEVFI